MINVHLLQANIKQLIKKILVHNLRKYILLEIFQIHIKKYYIKYNFTTMHFKEKQIERIYIILKTFSP